MAQGITLWGGTYSNVPAVNLPKTGGGTARFDDCSVVTATASDVASGKVFVAADGTVTTGTASGGAPFTATITQTGVSTTAYVSYNNEIHYTLDDTFNYAMNDTLHIYLGDAYTVSIYVNGETVASNSGGSVRVSVEYDYTLPKSDIQIKITAANRNTRKVEIFTLPLLIEKEIYENGTYNATADGADGYSSVTVSVSGGGGGMNMQAYLGQDTRTANAYGATAVTLTVAKTGTYTVSWSAWRSSSSGTMGTNLHVNNTTGTNQTTWSNTYGQRIQLTNQSYTAGDVLTLYATSGSTTRTIGVCNLIIEQTS